MEKTRCPGCMKLKASGAVCEHCGFDENTQNASHQLQIGTVLNEQYRIGKVLGQGGFGITYLGWDLYLDIPVAIKEYYPSGTVMREATVTMNVADITGDDGVRFRNNRDRFMREAKMLARFSQVPEIVQVKNFFQANNTAYIVMEYVEGITLKQHIRNQGGRLTGEETFAILGPVIQTLAKVHKTGIIHRDISPDNIMMVEHGAKLLDFGAVRSVVGASVDRELTKSTEAILKQGYAPIEQYQKKGSLGPWTDVYALCATIYYCLTGEVPPDSPARVLEYEVLEFDKIPGITTWQRDALRHGMELRADKRTGSMEALYRELFEIPVVENPVPVVPVVSEPEPPVVPEPELPVVAEPEISVISEPAEPEIPVQEPDFPVTESFKTVTGFTQVRSGVHQVIPADVQEPKGPTVIQPGPVSMVSEKIVSEIPMPETGSKTKDKPKPKVRLGLLAAIVGAVAVLALVISIGIGLSDKREPTTIAAEEAGANIVSGDCGNSAYWKLDLDTGVLTIDGVHMHDFYVEEYNEEMRRYKAARPWEEYTDQITEVVLSDNLYRIGTAAFAHCPNLTKVTFGKTLKEIGGDAFWDTGLTYIDLPTSVEVIGWSAFEGTKIRNVIIPMFVKDLGHMAFHNCPNLEKVEILGSIGMNFDTWSPTPIFSRGDGDIDDITIWGQPGGIVETYANIYGYAFEYMGSGVAVEAFGDFSGYPGDVDGGWRFDRESSFLMIWGEMPTDMLGQWEIDNGVADQQRINDVPQAPWADFAEDIKTVYIRDGVTRISPNAFAHCNNLTDIHLPSTLKSIGFQAFLGTNVDEIVLPESVEEIHSFAFNWCTNLRVVKLPSTLWTLPTSAFNCCWSLERVYATNATRFMCEVNNGQKVTPFNHITQPDDENGVDENALPENLTICTPVGQQGAYVSAAKLFCEEYGIRYETGVFGHDNAEVTGEAAFGTGGVYWALENGVLTLMGSGETPFYRSGQVDRNAWNRVQPATLTLNSEAPWYPFRNEIHTVIVEEGITTLNRGVFVNMPNLQNLDLGSVEKIYAGAIENCGITRLDLPDTLYLIHEAAILDCIDLRSIHVHNGSEKVDDGIIQGCDNLEELYFWSGSENIWPQFDLFERKYPRNLTIYGHAGSTAEAYAQRSGIPFETIQ